MSGAALQPIAALIAEHDVIVAIAVQASSALGAGDLHAAARCAVEIAELLGPLTAVEEEGLFPALAVEFPHEVEWLVSQHRQIKADLAEAAQMAGSGRAVAGWDVRLADALYLLREHIVAEQEGAFPAALAVLGPDQWAAVDAVRARVSASTAAVPIGADAGSLGIDAMSGAEAVHGAHAVSQGADDVGEERLFTG